MEQIRFKTGEFQTFTATRSFALGNFNVRIEKGCEIAFDGSVVQYAGTDYAFPQLRGALTSGWIVLASSYDEDDPDYGRPASANVKVRSATQGDQPKTMVATVEADERIVMNSSEHASQTKASNRRTASEAGSDGVPVRTLKTPAVSATTITDAQSVISGLDNLKITPGKGITVEEMLERMPQDQREEYLLRKQAARAGYVQEQKPSDVRTAASQPKSGSGKTVGRVKNAAGVTSAEGMTVTQSTGGGIETWDGGDASVVAALSQDKTTIVEDGISFTTTNVPSPKAAPKKQAPLKTSAPAPQMSPAVRLKIAKAMCPDFPDSYDFAAPAKKKLARLQADFEDRLDILLAVFAAEDDEIKTKLVQEFPQAFV